MKYNSPNDSDIESFDMSPLELDFLEELLKLLDAHLVKIRKDHQEYEDYRAEAHLPDECGYPPDGEYYFKDRCEPIIGLGFVAIQEFLSY